MVQAAIGHSFRCRKKEGIDAFCKLFGTSLQNIECYRSRCEFVDECLRERRGNLRFKKAKHNENPSAETHEEMILAIKALEEVLECKRKVERNKIPKRNYPPY